MVLWTQFGAIRSKADCQKFRKCVQTDENYGVRIHNEHGKIIEFIRNGDNWSVREYMHEIGMLGWVTMELASDTNPAYDETVDDLIWKYRKALNAYLNRD